MKYEQLRSLIKSPVFYSKDIALGDNHIFGSQLTAWVKKGYITRLKNGIYCFNSELDSISGEHVSSIIYEPSYLSLEKALSYHGIIPEIVHTYTLVTTKTNRIFNNIKGKFAYQHIKKSLFWGYTEEINTGGRFLIAEPEKALLDFLYLKMASINNQEDVNSFRFNLTDLNISKLKKYAKAYDVKKISTLVNLCLQ